MQNSPSLGERPSGRLRRDEGETDGIPSRPPPYTFPEFPPSQELWEFCNRLQALTSRHAMEACEFVSDEKGIRQHPAQLHTYIDPADTAELINLYFSSPKKKFSARYDRIVDFDPLDAGMGLMRDAQTTKPQSFRTGDGWFAFNLATNLAQME